MSWNREALNWTRGHAKFVIWGNRWNSRQSNWIFWNCSCELRVESYPAMNWLLSYINAGPLHMNDRWMFISAICERNSNWRKDVIGRIPRQRDRTFAP